LALLQLEQGGTHGRRRDGQVGEPAAVAPQRRRQMEGDAHGFAIIYSFSAMPRMPKTPFGKQFDALEARFEKKRLVREIGAAARKMRSETNWRQPEGAQSSRTSQTTISRIEPDVTARPRRYSLGGTAAYLPDKLRHYRRC